MYQLIKYYNLFLKFFPPSWHVWVSLAILAIMIMLILRYLKVGIIGILLLVIFVPASVPVFREIGIDIFLFAKYLLLKR